MPEGPVRLEDTSLGKIRGSTVLAGVSGNNVRCQNFGILFFYNSIKKVDFVSTRKKEPFVVKNLKENTEIVKELKIGTSQFTTGYKKLQNFYNSIQNGDNEDEINNFIKEKFFSRSLDKTVKLEQDKFSEYLRIKIGRLQNSFQVISKELTGDSGLKIKKWLEKQARSFFYSEDEFLKIFKSGFDGEPSLSLKIDRDKSSKSVTVKDVQIPSFKFVSKEVSTLITIEMKKSIVGYELYLYDSCPVDGKATAVIDGYALSIPKKPTVSNKRINMFITAKMLVVIDKLINNCCYSIGKVSGDDVFKTQIYLNLNDLSLSSSQYLYSKKQEAPGSGDKLLVLDLSTSDALEKAISKSINSNSCEPLQKYLFNRIKKGVLHKLKRIVVEENLTISEVLKGNTPISLLSDKNISEGFTSRDVQNLSQLSTLYNSSSDPLQRTRILALLGEFLEAERQKNTTY